MQNSSQNWKSFLRRSVYSFYYDIYIEVLLTFINGMNWNKEKDSSVTFIV